jgi:hypothetical protein
MLLPVKQHRGNKLGLFGRLRPLGAMFGEEGIERTLRRL